MNTKSISSFLTTHVHLSKALKPLGSLPMMQLNQNDESKVSKLYSFLRGRCTLIIVQLNRFKNMIFLWKVFKIILRFYVNKVYKIN